MALRDPPAPAARHEEEPGCPGGPAEAVTGAPRQVQEKSPPPVKMATPESAAVSSPPRPDEAAAHPGVEKADRGVKDPAKEVLSP